MSQSGPGREADALRWETTLSYAAWAGATDRVRELLDAGSDPDDGGGDKTPLMEAVDEPEGYYDAAHQEITGLLLARGADPNRKDRRGWTPLHYGAGAGRFAVEVLIVAGAEVNATAADGSTALHVALERVCLSAVAALISHGADLGARDVNGITSRDLALSHDAGWAADERATIMSLLDSWH